MAYVAVRGGREAIENAERYLRYQRDAGPTPPLQVAQVAARLHLTVDRVMGEGSLYAPDLAALALIQSAGDTFEAAFALRAHRATLPRVATSLAEGSAAMRVIRRISSAFKEIPGGQILGPTPDYTLRLLDFSLVEEDPAARAARGPEIAGGGFGCKPVLGKLLRKSDRNCSLQAGHRPWLNSAWVCSLT